MDIAREFFKARPQELAPLYSQYVINNRSDYYEYFEFLFAGKLSSGDVNHQNRFVMRDLGLTATREGHSESLSRFETLDEAQSNYLLNRYRLAFKNITDESDYVALASQVLVQAAHGAIAVVLKTNY
ncbi:hypothetical protein P4S63_17440 [Pseudoalteromonas sp. B193]